VVDLEKALKYFGGQKYILNILLSFVVLVIIGYMIVSVELSRLEDFSIVIVGIIIQAIPFLLMGTIVSSFIRTFVSDELIVKFFPKKSMISTLSAVGVGIFLPLCDCAVIPVAARLRHKGVPISAVVTFIMAAPVVNPVVILATIYAFPNSNIAMYRVVVGVIIAVITGYMLRAVYSNSIGSKNEILKENISESSGCGCCSHGHGDLHEKHECGHHHNQYVEDKTKIKFLDRFIKAIVHSGEEFFQVSKLFIIGVFITSFIQVFIPRSFITDFAGGTFSSVIIMMIVAFVMSICSTSDSFIGRGFASTVPMSGVFAFVVFGPVLDLKNAIMMAGFFKKKFVTLFVTIAFLIAFIVISISSMLLFR
jgi:uncharacterized membrane protein YraQ (UPF0718 family)